MAWKVVFSIRSRDDLRRIVEFIARDDPTAAERFGMALIAQSEALADTPHLGVPLRERPGTRFLPHGSYLIIYRPDAARARGRCDDNAALRFSS